ncbi:hypothetical protein [Nonomuraea sp. SYSU D8015]|uniref:hypothetical protein n=1 Tax=Nonomuraea sp. SYSU D8015 TaxID=2593644 RepID=UPI0016611023|nr:hypothetical protein [Nonomuraea sp. SYSU D8015]
MLTYVDVRRTAGGLQLTFMPPGRSMRIHYDDAAALAQAMMTDQRYALPGRRRR